MTHQRLDLLVHHGDPRARGEARRPLRARLAACDIDSTVHYPNLLEQPAFRHCRGEVPVTARESRRMISLPLHQGICAQQIDRICATVRGFSRSSRPAGRAAAGQPPGRP